MRVLITGGAGFVGRHFTNWLLNSRHDVWIVDNLCAGLVPTEWPFKARRHRSIVCYVRDVRGFFKDYPADDFDLIIHCAAIVGGRLNIDGDPLAVATDLSIDAEFFNWVVRAKNRPKIIYFSSSAVYPIELQQRNNHVDLAEDLVLPQHQLRIGMPDQTYGWSKLSGEVLAQHAVKDYDADVIIYRPFGGYGEDQSFDYPFPSIIRRIVNGENPVTVWGSGDQRRDFIHIEDIVEIVLQTMNVLKPGETLNLGTGFGLSFRDLAQTASGVLGIPINIVNDASKPEGVFSRVCDPYQLEQLYKMPEPLERLKWGIKKVAGHLLKQKEPV